MWLYDGGCVTRTRHHDATPYDIPGNYRAGGGNPLDDHDPDPRATPEQVEKAIAKAKEYLYSLQTPKGDWEINTRGKIHSNGARLWGGYTALATYALLAAGESPQNEKLKPAIKFLQNESLNLTYAAGLRSQVWTFLPMTDDLRKAVLNDANIYLKGADKNGRYGYNTLVHGGEHNSTSQYGVLGMWACATGRRNPPRLLGPRGKSLENLPRQRRGMAVSVPPSPTRRGQCDW